MKTKLFLSYLIIIRKKMEEEFADLEKEKVIRELELKEMMAKHKTEIRNLEMQLSSLKVGSSLTLQLE